MADYIKELRASIGHMKIVIPGVRGILVDDQVQTFTVAFLVHEWSGELSVDSDEVVDVRLVPLDALPENVWPVHRVTLQDYLTFSVPIVK